MVAMSRLAVPKVVSLLVGATLCLPLATAKDEHPGRSVGALAIGFPATMQPASFAWTPSTAYSIDQPLIATLDVVRLSPESALYVPSQRIGASGISVFDEASQARPSERFGLQLPRPDRWSAVAATLALALFFFARRLV